MWLSPSADLLNAGAEQTSAAAPRRGFERAWAHPAQLTASVVVLIAAASLCGWIFHIPILVSVLPASVEMKANTAACLIGCAIAQFNLTGLPRPSVLRRLAQLMALGAALVGVATLSEYLMGWNLNLDELLVKDGAHAFTPISGRMSPFSAIAIAALGTAIATIPIRSSKWGSQLAGTLAVIVGMTTLVGYLWNASELITDRWLPPVAVNTAACFALLGIGLVWPEKPLNLKQRLATLATVEVKILASLLLAMTLLLFGGSYTYRTSVKFADSVGWVANTQEVRAALAGVYASLAGAELALRDYLISGEPARRADYVDLTKALQDRLAELEDLTSDSAPQQANLSNLKNVIATRLGDMSTVMLAYRSYGLPAARAINKARQQITSTRDVADVVQRMDALEVGLLAERVKSTERLRHTTLISMLITLAVASALFFALFRAIHREMLARRDAEDALRASAEYNQSILESSPDCLAILTLDARISYMTSHSMELMDVPDMSSIANLDWIASWAGEEQMAAQSAVDAAREGSRGRFHGFRATQAGTPKWWDVIVMPIRGVNGRIERLLAVARDMTERKWAEQAICDLNTELRDKATALEAANKEMESFSYSVSHDLRAPLRAIDGFALMVEEDYKDRLDAEGRRYLSVIRENSRKMGHLIDDLLVFSRLGRQPVASGEVDIGSLAHETVEEALAAASGPQITIGALPPARGDRALLRQVWVNLISNAIKYSGKSPAPLIRVSGKRVGSENHYSVSDNGVGFDMAYANKLFGVFQRLHRADQFAGTGVGLAIVHRIVTRHGGRAWAEGKIDQGATFSFSLPTGERHE